MFVLHNGSDETVLESLAEFSLPKHCIPKDLGEWKKVKQFDPHLDLSLF